MTDICCRHRLPADEPILLGTRAFDWLAEGLSAEISVPAYPGRTWEGQVEYIYPELDPVSRTLKVRLAFGNPDGLLKANMFADVVIYGGPKRDVLAVPAEAVIETGRRSSVVLALGGGRFQPVDVVTGMRGNGMVEILSGLSDDDVIVTVGQVGPMHLVTFPGEPGTLDAVGLQARRTYHRALDEVAPPRSSPTAPPPWSRRPAAACSTRWPACTASPRACCCSTAAGACCRRQGAHSSLPK